MKRLSIPWLLEAIEKADTVVALPQKATFEDAWFQLYDFKFQIDDLYSSEEMLPFLRISRQKYVELTKSLELAIKEINETKELDTFMLKYHIQSLRPLLIAELNVTPSFIVTGKGGYDVNILIDRGEVLFPSLLISKAPETEPDAKEAGRALVFELATACGFHTFRVTESVTRRYWDAVAKAPRPKLDTIGNVTAELEKAGFGCPKIWQSLKQLSRLHRNPIIHPEVILNVEEAIAIVGIARSVIGAMLEVLPVSSPEATSGLPQLFETVSPS